MSLKKSEITLLKYAIVVCVPLLFMLACIVYNVASEIILAYEYRKTPLPFISFFDYMFPWGIIFIQLLLVVLFLPSFYRDSIFSDNVCPGVCPGPEVLGTVPERHPAQEICGPPTTEKTD